MKAGILLSGGIDSVALTCWKKPQYAYTIDYGQLCAQAEIEASEEVCRCLEIAHTVIRIPCRELGAGDLSGNPQAINSPAPEWWPYRNQLLITVAAMKAYSDGVDILYFGSVKTDGFHIDGRKEFFEKIDGLISFQEGRMKVVAPAIELTSAELVKISCIDSSLLSWSHSCHVSNYACGFCRGCTKHLEVIRELGDEYS